MAFSFWFFSAGTFRCQNSYLEIYSSAETEILLNEAHQSNGLTL